MTSTLIIGASSGIGEAFFGLAAKGASKKDKFWTPTTFELDASKDGDMYNYVQANGPFDEMVYCAGVNHLEWIRDIEVEDFEELMRVNVLGFVDMISLHESFFPESRGSILAISSDAGQNPMRGSMKYCVSKAALDMAVKVAARELAPRWRVNAVAPAMIDGTGMSAYIDEAVPEFRGWSVEKTLAYEKANIPVGRRGTVDEVAQVMLATLRGPGFQTGSIVGITGGK